MLAILLDILDRLRNLPGLGFLHWVYEDLRNKKATMELKANKLSNARKLTQAHLKRAADIPSVLKGSKKRT